MSNSSFAQNIIPIPVTVVSGGTGSTDGSITGTTDLTFTAGSPDKSITLSPTGTGVIKLDGSTRISKLYPASDTTTAIQINKADNTTNVVTVDTTNSNVGIGTTAPANMLHVHKDSGAYSTSSYMPVSFQLSAENTNTHFSGIRFTNRTNVREAMFGVVQTASNAGDFVFQGYNATAVAYQEYLRINNAGNVGIGTTNPLGKLEIAYATAGSNSLIAKNTSATGYGPSFWGAATTQYALDVANYTGTSLMRILGSGNVGIGTTVPAYRLEVDWITGDATATAYFGSPSVNNNQIAVYGQSYSSYALYGSSSAGYGIGGISVTGYGGYFLVNPSTTNTLVDVAYFRRATSGTAAAGIGSSIVLTAEADNGSSGVDAAAGRIGAILTNATYTTEASALVFQTRTGGAALSEKVRIDGSGNVGIGTTSPSYALDVQSANGNIQVAATTGTNYSILRVVNSGGEVYVGRESSGGGSLVTGSTGYAGTISVRGTYPLQLAVNNAIAMTILNGGNVGIGTTNPLSKLHLSDSSSATFRGFTLSNHVDQTSSARFNFLRSRGSSGSPTTLTNADYIGILGAQGYDGSNYIEGGIIGFIVNGTVSAGSVPTDFFVNTGSSGNSERLRITSAGLVGIGTTSPTSTLHVAGSQTVAYRAITALRTLDATDYFIDCTSGTYNVTLPTAVNITGRVYVIKNSGTGVVTVVTTSSQTIDGSLTMTLSSQYQSITVVSNGANWCLI